MKITDLIEQAQSAMLLAGETAPLSIRMTQGAFDALRAEMNGVLTRGCTPGTHSSSFKGMPITIVDGLADGRYRPIEVVACPM